MTQADLQKALRAIDPAAVLVSPRILERVIREELQLPNMYWNIPHRKSYVCDRQSSSATPSRPTSNSNPTSSCPTRSSSSSAPTRRR